ncbi:TetR/AcrR family transcriptional regulator [Nocardia sp. NPDC050406]|uniref:TetR/AcrR family transcriptional regulator n=1 Tax=Nocardia sp. NPDC050406 TaxID=3364318 RepID=UPI00378E0C1F
MTMTNVPTRRQMYTAQTREALLEAARTAFVDRGYAQTSIEDITAAARISKGAFYRHFADKQAVFIELFADRLRDAAVLIREAVTTIRAGAPGQGIQSALACAYEFAQRSVTDPLHRELLRQAPEVLGEQKYVAIDDELVLPPLLELLTALADRGELRDGIPLATTARLLLRLLCASNTLIANATDREAILTECTITVALFFSGIVQPDAAAP